MIMIKKNLVEYQQYNFLLILTNFERRVVVVKPLLVPELLVKSDGKYRATLWLRNPGPSR